MPSHYLKHCWGIVNWTLMNKLQWNLYQSTKLFIHKNASGNIVCKMVAILSRGRWVKPNKRLSCITGSLCQRAAFYKTSPHKGPAIWSLCFCSSDTKPLPEPTYVDLPPVKSCDNHMWAISQEIPQPSVDDISLKIAYLKFHSDIPGANQFRCDTVKCCHNSV